MSAEVVMRIFLNCCLFLSLCVVSAGAQETSVGRDLFVQNCQSCHGPGGGHAQAPRQRLLLASEYPCLGCHAADSAKPAGFPQMSLPTHGGQLPCVTCHSPHKPEVRAVPKMSHRIFQGASCSTCHGTQASPRPLPPSHNRRPTEVCLICHSS